MKKILLTISSLVVTFSSAQAWNISGNSGTNPSTDFLGTIDAQPLIFKTNNSEKARITPNGNVGIGTTNPQAKLDVNGEARILHGLDIYDESVNGSNLRIAGNGGYIPAGLTFADTSYNQAGQVARWSIWKGNTWAKGLGFMRYDAVNPCGTGICDIPFFLADTGNVGINNTSPVAKLDVNGDVRIANIPASTSSTDQPLVVDAQGFVKKGSLNNGNISLSEKQIVNARATGYAIIAAKNPGINFPVFVIPWDGVNTLEYNANNQINPSWHPQVVIKGNYFNQPFDGSDFSIYSSFVTSQSDFDLYKSTGTQWWIVCSTLPSFSKSITSNENTGNVAITNKLEAKEIKVTLTPTADFVFEKNYGLPKLEEVEKFIKENKHLPEIASAKEMEKEGVNVGEFQIKLLQKIEELTLYSIDLNKKNKEQEVLIKSQADILKSLHERLDKIEKIKQK